MTTTARKRQTSTDNPKKSGIKTKPRTEAEKQHRNELDPARRQRIAMIEGRDCTVGRPALPDEERQRRQRERRRAWRQTEAGRARQARKNAKRKAKLLEGREVIIRLELGVV
jgi:hypothetical protein